MKIFKHPAQVCMTYTEHMKLSLEFSLIFFKASATALTHAFIPDVFITSTSDTVKIVEKKIKESGCR